MHNVFLIRVSRQDFHREREREREREFVVALTDLWQTSFYNEILSRGYFDNGIWREIIIMYLYRG